jgi:hypothetical protein
MKRIYLFQVISNFKLVWLLSQIGLDLGISVIDDGEEHVEKNEENKENVENEVGGSEDAVGLLQSLEVEVAEDYTEQGEAVVHIRSI